MAWAVVSSVGDRYHDYDTVVEVVVPTEKAAKQFAAFCNRFEVPFHEAEDFDDDYGRYFGVFPVRM